MKSMFIALLASSLTFAAWGQEPAQRHNGHAAAATTGSDSRQAVRFPSRLRQHTLANMRDHLLALQQIQEALARHDYDQAGDLAEHRLGMSSLRRHGAHEVAGYMPRGMQMAGSAMHRSASRFGVAARDVGATGELAPAIAALADLTAQCNACHAGYRLQ